MTGVIENFLSVYGWVILFALGTVVGLYYLTPYGYAATKMQKTLLKVRAYLVQKLGDKAAFVIDIWIEGLDAIKDGNFTEEEMIAEFIKIIRLKAPSLKFTPDEIKFLEEAASITVKSIDGKKVNKIAFEKLSKIKD